MKYFSVLRNQEEVFIVGPQFFQQPSFFLLLITDIPVGDEGKKYFLQKFIGQYGNISGDKPLTDEVFQSNLSVGSMKIHTRVLDALFLSVRNFNKLKSGKSQESEIFAVNLFGSQNKHVTDLLYVKLMTVTTVALLFGGTVKAQNYDGTPSKLGPFELQLRTENPLRESIKFNYRPSPTAVDFDRDGDTDVVIASFDGGEGFSMLRNDGTASTAAFNYAELYDNPFNYIAFDDGATTTFSDLDQDGDLDLFLGTIDGTFRYYRNNSNRTNPFTLQNSAWNATTKTGNPLYGIDLGDYASPAFIDMDNDGDQDLVIGTSYLPNNKSVHYYTNDGSGNFSPATLSGINPNLEEATPSFIDADGDGDKDLFLGAANGNIYYFKRTGQTSFEEQTGNNNPFNGINKGANSSPSAADFDNDGDADLIVGADNSKLDIFYFENKGNSLFEEKTGFASPFGGTTIGRDASPYFIDLDTDGDQDLLIGNSDNTAPFLRYFKNENGKYVEETANNPFNQTLTADRFVPSFIDIDGDGDKDLVGSVDNSDMTWIEYFKNESGSFVRQDFEIGPFSTISIDDGRSEFGDIDSDGDFDLFVAERDYASVNPIYFIRFFKNTGTTQTPVFTERNGTGNPLNQVLEDFELLPRLIDIDHDGDLDALIGEGGGVVETADGNEFSYYENTGTSFTPSFTYRGDLLDQGTNPHDPAPSFVDQDNDGDLDLFVGSVSGQLSFYKNVNPAAVATVTSGNLTFFLGSNAVVIDPLFQLTDADNDSIVFASVSISPYETGKETLTFTAQGGITGTFDPGAGILTFRGKAPVSSYLALLKSVAYQYTALDISTGRQHNPKSATLPRTLTFLISDADGTSSAPVSKNVTVLSGQPPVFTDTAINLFAGASLTVDLTQFISDADGNINLTSLSVVQPPLSGAVTSIVGNGNLFISYQSLAFTGVETLVVQACDADNNCDQSTISVNVTNTAPVFTDEAVTVSFGGQGSVNLVPLISDAESNLDLSTVTIVQNPTSGARATIEIISSAEINLVLDYSGITFIGTDQVTISVCDQAGACSESIVSVNVAVSSSITVFNAVAPKSTYDNTFLRIENLPAGNKVTIFNRWGDVVFEKEKYDNDQRKFEGVNQNGHILPSGTYFYQIEFPDESNKRQTLTGYLSLKQ